ncbi:MAG: hypothetical protein ACIAQF_08290, partial [Phycisphaerales bacterium JB065]
MATPRNMLKAGAKWAASVVKENDATEVVYRRGSKSVTVIASVGHTELDSITDDGSTTSYQSRDFKFTRSDLD